MAVPIEPVEIRTTAANDWIWVVVGSSMSILLVFVLVTSDASDWQSSPGMRHEELYRLLVQLVGVTGFQMFAWGLALFCGLNAVGGAWRLRDDGFALRADQHGLVLHPSFFHSQLRWSDVESIELIDGHPPRIAIKPKRRFWSLSQPFTGRAVQLNIISVGRSYETAQIEVDKMHRWQER